MKKILKEAFDWLLHIGIAILIGVLFVTFIAQRTIVHDISMEPTLVEGDNLIVEKVSKAFGNIDRGDIIVFKEKGEDRQLIKRVIALEGDYVNIEDGVVFVNGEPIDEDYLEKEIITTAEYNSLYGEIIVPEGHVYVLGDNRPASKDSRVLGPVDMKSISGKAVLRFFPFNRFTMF